MPSTAPATRPGKPIGATVPSEPADAQGVLAALKSLRVAILSGDAVGARSRMLLATDADEAAGKKLLREGEVQLRYAGVLRKRFGLEGAQKVVRDPLPMSLGWVDDAEIEIDDNKACAVSGGKTIRLERRDGRWLVSPPVFDEQTRRWARLADLIIDAEEALTLELEQGKYRTPDEVNAAFSSEYKKRLDEMMNRP